MTSPANERRTKRYAEDEEFRASTRAYNRAWYKANKDRVNAESRRKRAENPTGRQSSASAAAAPNARTCSSTATA
jgi:hypothetical protein